MSIVFMGTPDFAAANLMAISDAGHTILAAVSQPDKPVGRHSDLKPTPVKLTAQALGNRSSAVMGWRVLGLSGGRGLVGMTAAMLNHCLGISSSGRK